MGACDLGTMVSYRIPLPLVVFITTGVFLECGGGMFRDILGRDHWHRQFKLEGDGDIGLCNHDELLLKI